MPAPEPTPKRGSAWLSILLAAGWGLFLLSLLFLLTGGAAIAIAAAGAVATVAAGFHYFVWGWWLSGLIERDVAEEEDERSDHSP